METPQGFDVLVVGGGTAGCVLAARLSEDGSRSVGMVEAGPDFGPLADDGWPRELVDARVMTDAFDWHDDRDRLGAARVVGGSSAVNACALTRPPDADLDGWAPGWGASVLGPCFERAERTLAPRRFIDGELSPWWTAVADGAAEAGIVPGAAPIALNVHGTTRWNAAFAFLDAARRRPNLTVIGDAVADSIVFDGEWAVGVRAIVGGARVDFPAGAVVLCAGAYGSPAVLLRSGVGPEDELRRHGIEARAILPVGEQLAEHFGVRIRLEPSDDLIEALAIHVEEHEIFLAQGMVFATRPGAPGWDVHLVPMLMPAGAGRVAGAAGKPYSLGLTAMLLQPAWRGRVTLASADASTIPVASPVTFAGADVDAAVAALELGRTLLSTRTGSAAVERELVPGDAAPRGDAAREFLAAETPSRYFHPTGTCALGSVLDERARVRGFANLWVADASLIPRPVRAGTNFTVMAIAEHVATLVA